MRYQFFFDESGKSHLSDSSKSGQENLVLAGLLVEWDSPFWSEVEQAWLLAAKLLSKQPTQIELHATDIYGGRNDWDNIPNRAPVLEAIFSAIKACDVRIYWTGLPVKKLAAVSHHAWRKTLVQYLHLVHAQLSTQLPGEQIEVYGDANDWVKEERALEHDNWTSFFENRAVFKKSHDVHGVQIADVVAHTLYRANKSKPANSDALAETLRKSIAPQILHLPH